MISLPDLLTMIGNSFALLSSRTRARLSCLVQPGLMILGDLSIQGNIKTVKSLSEPLQVGMDNDARRALIPLENKRGFLEVSGDVIERVDPNFYADPMTAAMKGLGMT